uniref:Uncharacterized protein n=1 Tax=Serinus canaria TaxID=9135 RepID=A0A8C9N1D3_SERCA
MGRGAAAAAGLVALVVLGAPPAAGTELSGVFQWIAKAECYFINGTERVKYVERHSYNREQLLHFHSDKVARYWNSLRDFMRLKRTAAHCYCRSTCEVSAVFLTECRVPPTVSISLVPSSSQPSPGCLLCSVMDFYSAHIQLRWFQGQQELPVVATDVVPNGDWTYQLLVLLETVEHVSLEHPLSRHRHTGRHWDVLGATGRELESLVETGRGSWVWKGRKGVWRVRWFGGDHGGHWEGVWGAGCNWEGFEWAWRVWKEIGDGRDWVEVGYPGKRLGGVLVSPGGAGRELGEGLGVLGW